jgi:hypothetical protein
MSLQSSTARLRSLSDRLASGIVTEVADAVTTSASATEDEEEP